MSLTITIDPHQRAFITPPKGDINASVLKGCAMLYAVIPSAIVREALKEGKAAKFTHGETHIEIDTKK